MTTIDDINEVTHARAFHAQHHQRFAVTLDIGLVGNPYSGLTQTQRAKAYAGDIIAMLTGSDDLTPLDYRASPETNVLLQTYVTAHKTPESLKVLKETARHPLVMWSEHVTEPTDVIHFDIEPLPGSDHDTARAIRALTYRLALLLSQEAIAATYRDEGARDISTREQGELIAGPKAIDWNNGVFNPAYFQRFNASVDNIAARF